MTPTNPNPYKTGPYEAIRKLIIQGDAVLPSFPSIEALGIIAVFELDAKKLRFFGLSMVATTLGAHIFYSSAICRNGEELPEGLPYYYLADDLKEIEQEMVKYPEVAFYCYVDFDEAGKTDRLFMLGRRLPTDEFQLHENDVRYVRESFKGVARSVGDIPIEEASYAESPIS
ncbi:MAG TPA: hypothetical protein VLA04_06670 [Verrucomicrobiae bacterium]|nr:hypothetical protein [Verrucomicrobiae bacterium]